MANKIIEESYNTTTMQNSNMNNSALQMRLETQHLIESLELFLRGAKIVIKQDDTGKIYSETVSIGKPRANELGVQGILSHVSCLINTAVVQGNFPEDGKGSGISFAYEQFIYETDINITKSLIVKKNEWDLLDSDINSIADTIMGMVIPFMTRLIGNLERESYSGTLVQTDRNTVSKDEKKLGLW